MYKNQFHSISSNQLLSLNFFFIFLKTERRSFCLWQISTCWNFEIGIYSTWKQVTSRPWDRSGTSRRFLWLNLLHMRSFIYTCPDYRCSFRGRCISFQSPFCFFSLSVSGSVVEGWVSIYWVALFRFQE